MAEATPVEALVAMAVDAAIAVEEEAAVAGISAGGKMQVKQLRQAKQAAQPAQAAQPVHQHEAMPGEVNEGVSTPGAPALALIYAGSTIR